MMHRDEQCQAPTFPRCCLLLRATLRPASRWMVAPRARWTPDQFETISECQKSSVASRLARTAREPGAPGAGRQEIGCVTLIDDDHATSAMPRAAATPVPSCKSRWPSNIMSTIRLGVACDSGGVDEPVGAPNSTSELRKAMAMRAGANPVHLDWRNWINGQGQIGLSNRKYRLSVSPASPPATAGLKPSRENDRWSAPALRNEAASPKPPNRMSTPAILILQAPGRQPCGRHGLPTAALPGPAGVKPCRWSRSGRSRAWMPVPYTTHVKCSV